MSEYGTMSANVRDQRGKGAARSLRRQGLIPGVMYGAGKENVSVSVDPRELRKATDPARAWNTLFHVTLKQDGKSDRVEPCMVSDVQLDSVRREVVHVDLMRVDPDKDIVRQVPVTFSGRSIGVFKGGKLKTFRRFVKVAAKPGAVPVEVAIDITPVEGGESIRIKDIDLGDARLVENPEQRLCFVDMPKAKPAEEDEAAKDKEKGKKK